MLSRDSQYRGPVLGVIWPMWVSPGAPLLGQVWEGLRSWAPASPAPAEDCFSCLARRSGTEGLLSSDLAGLSPWGSVSCACARQRLRAETGPGQRGPGRGEAHVSCVCDLLGAVVERCSQKHVLKSCPPYL